jgi:hypothetical protein
MAAAVDDVYQAPSGAVLLAGRTSPIPSWLRGAAPGEWVEVPNSQPSTADGLVPAVSGSMGSRANMVNAWCGAASYGTRFLIHGGGHADYGGNEIGYIDLGASDPEWGLLVERTPVSDLLGGSNYYADGRPTSRHTYYAMTVLPINGVDRFLRFNGWMGFAYNGSPVGGSADVRTTKVDGFRLDTMEWEPAALGDVPEIVGSETPFAVDRTTGDCYAWRSSPQRVYRWQASTQASAKLADLSGTEGAGGACVFDHGNGRLVRFMGQGSAGCVYYTVATSSKSTASLSGPGASVLTSPGEQSVKGWGAAHDTKRNVAWLMTNSAQLLRVSLDDFYVEAVDVGGEVASSATNGVWGKLQYIEKLDAIAYLAKWDSPVLMMRCF